MAHDVIERHPQWQALQEERQRLRDAEQAHRQRVAEVMEPYWQAMQAWERDRPDALLSGREVPDPPQKPDVDDNAPHVFAREHERLREKQKQVLAAIAEDVERDAAEEIARELAAVEPHVREVLACLPRLGALVQAVREVRSAVDRADPNLGTTAWRRGKQQRPQARKPSAGHRSLQLGTLDRHGSPVPRRTLC